MDFLAGGGAPLLGALGGRLDGLALGADLGGEKRAVLAGGRLDGGCRLGVGGIGRGLLGVHGHLRERANAAVDRLIAGLLEVELIGVVKQGGSGEEVVVVEGHVGSDGWLDDRGSCW